MQKLFFVFVGALIAALQSRKVGEGSTVSDANLFDGFKSAVDTALKSIGETVSNAVEKFGTPYDEIIVSAARQNGIEPSLLYRLLNQESRFRPDIITGKTLSPAGAMGIAQFMPATAREWLGSTANALKPEIAIPGAARYLKWLIGRTGGNVEQAVAAYNWGIGNLQKFGYDKAPRETRDYVKTVYFGA